MSPDRYYVADVQEGTKLRRLYFYASVGGLTDPEYGYTEDNSWIEPAYELIVSQIEKGLHAEPGMTVTVSGPREINPDDLVKQDPELNVHVLKAIALAEKEISEALHPIKMVWHWLTKDDYSEEVPVSLTLADDVVMLPAAFVLKLQQLTNEPLMKWRISQVYQDLLAIRSRTLIKNLLRGNVGAGKD